MTKLMKFLNSTKSKMTLMIEPRAVWYEIPPNATLSLKSARETISKEIEIEFKESQLSVWVEEDEDYASMKIEITPGAMLAS